MNDEDVMSAAQAPTPRWDPPRVWITETCYMDCIDRGWREEPVGKYNPRKYRQSAYLRADVASPAKVGGVWKPVIHVSEDGQVVGDDYPGEVHEYELGGVDGPAVAKRSEGEPQDERSREQSDRALVQRLYDAAFHASANPLYEEAAGCIERLLAEREPPKRA